MASHSGILGLARGMRAFFASPLTPSPNGAPVVAVGWTPRSRQDNQGAGGAGRIVLIPGEFDATSPATPKSLRAGTIDRDFEQNFVGNQGNLVGNQNMRIRAMWHAALTCSVWAVDPDQPQDEEGQIGATEDLLEFAIQALHYAVDPVTGQTVGAANVEYGEASWTLPPGEAGFGRELTFGIVIRVPLFDPPTVLAFPKPAIARNPAA
jgi:hypothetical protein